MTGIQLKSLRIQADLTQSELADRLGVERSYIAHLERRDHLTILIEMAVEAVLNRKRAER